MEFDICDISNAYFVEIYQESQVKTEGIYIALREKIPLFLLQISLLNCLLPLISHLGVNKWVAFWSTYLPLKRTQLFRDDCFGEKRRKIFSRKELLPEPGLLASNGLF